MKKLALALVCLVSVAFFASCDPKIQNPEPAIEVLTTDGYIQNGDVLEMFAEYSYGFRCASNAETQAELSKLVVECNGTILCDTAISGTEFVFEGMIYFDDSEEARELVGSAEIIATVTDVDGKFNKATINVDINKEDNLPVADFIWNRHGGQAATGNLAELGLEWKINAKEIYAVIVPMDGAQLYRFDGSEHDVWNSVNTASEKAALFSEDLDPITDLREVSCTAVEKDYDIVIGTIYNNETHLIHITKSKAYTFKGTDVTIEGQYK